MELQVIQPESSRPQYAKRGEREAARQLGLDRDDVRRAAKEASITPEAQQAAHEVGNRWATKSKQLLAFASRWVQLVGIWWASGGQAFILPGKLFHRKMSSTIAALKNMCAWSVL